VAALIALQFVNNVERNALCIDNRLNQLSRQRSLLELFMLWQQDVWSPHSHC